MRLLPTAIVLAAPPAAAKAPGAHVSVLWTLHMTSRQKDGTIIDRGTATGAPFGMRKPIVVSTDVIAKGRVELLFTEQLGGARGSVNGLVHVRFHFNRKHTRVLYAGTGGFRDGTGAYAHASGPIRLSGYGLPNAHAKIRITGTVHR